MEPEKKMIIRDKWRKW